MTVRTLTERRQAEAARRAAAVAMLCRELAAAAGGFGGRYLLYGSAARGELRHDSDVDLLLDFPDAGGRTAAWTFAEDCCAALGLLCDIRPIEMCDAGFLAHVLPEAKALAEAKVLG